MGRGRGEGMGGGRSEGMGGLHTEVLADLQRQDGSVNCILQLQVLIVPAQEWTTRRRMTSYTQAVRPLQKKPGYEAGGTLHNWICK